jgi:hypothetical protein
MDALLGQTVKGYCNGRETVIVPAYGAVLQRGSIIT